MMPCIELLNRNQPNTAKYSTQTMIPESMANESFMLRPTMKKKFCCVRNRSTVINGRKKFATDYFSKRMRQIMMLSRLIVTRMPKTISLVLV